MNEQSETSSTRETLLDLVDEWTYYPEESRSSIMHRMVIAMYQKLPVWLRVIIIFIAVFASAAIGLAMSQSWELAFVMGAIVGLLVGRFLDHLRK